MTRVFLLRTCMYWCYHDRTMLCMNIRCAVIHIVVTELAWWKALSYTFNNIFSSISTVLGKIMEHLDSYVALLHIFLACLLAGVLCHSLFWIFVDQFAENCRMWCKSSSARTPWRISPFLPCWLFPIVHHSSLRQTRLSRSGSLSCHHDASRQSFFFNC